MTWWTAAPCSYRYLPCLLRRPHPRAAHTQLPVCQPLNRMKRSSHTPGYYSTCTLLLTNFNCPNAHLMNSCGMRAASILFHALLLSSASLWVHGGPRRVQGPEPATLSSVHFWYFVLQPRWCGHTILTGPNVRLWAPYGRCCTCSYTRRLWTCIHTTSAWRSFHVRKGEAAYGYLSWGHSSRIPWLLRVLLAEMGFYRRCW